MKNMSVTIDDKYLPNVQNAYMTGTQAVVRSLLEQRWLDQKNGLNTAGFISGYRGSPMTAMDEQLWRAQKHIDENHIRFWPGINENLAMTSVWGTQQVGFMDDALYDGVFSMWYGKGPGLDQTIDGLRQGNWHGATEHGGVLVLAGDDPCMRSTVNNYHSELLFEDLLMPVLYPANIQEVLDFSTVGIALSRFSGCWVGYKLLPETIETAARLDVSEGRTIIVTPEFEFPEGGVNSRLGDDVYSQEARIRQYRLPAAVAFARANKLNRVTHNSSKARFGIVAMGKIWRDTLQALTDLGIDESTIEEAGIRILKISMPFPADIQTYREFAEGLEEVIVVDEKRDQLESALREACYALPESVRPRIVGRKDEQGASLIKNFNELTPDAIGQAIAQRLKPFYETPQMSSRLDLIGSINQHVCSLEATGMARLPYFCSGCPHNSSTVTPEGSKSFGGVGCHFMATWMDRDVYTYTHMGGEGVPWIGQAPFVKTKHMFQNLGDGTYYHSGSLAIRAAIAAKINITYKILYNDAVAMTGGQPVDGPISVVDIAQQVRAEGIQRIAVVTDEPEKYKNYPAFPSNVSINHRKELELVQLELREIEGVTVLIYDQTCASEKRRRRKRGKFPDPAKRIFINDRVCEGCGDCGTKSNCLSIEPNETEFGRKRQINQSTCNKDYSCNNGFCPSFVTVLGGGVRKGKGLESGVASLPELPDMPAMQLKDQQIYGVLITGVGGTGVVTIGQLFGMAAHLDGKGVTVVDQLGFAQKGGPVKTHVQFSNKPDNIKAVRISQGKADLLLGCDMLAASDDQSLGSVLKGRSYAVINNHQSVTGDFTRDTGMEFPVKKVRERLTAVVGEDSLDFIESNRIATALMGDSIASNLFMVGHAWQKGRIPLSEEALMKSIELNGVAIAFNQQAFQWGRQFAHNQDAVMDLLQAASTKPSEVVMTLQQKVELRVKELCAYQNAKYADRYKQLVDRVLVIDQKLSKTKLSDAVAFYAHKLMAYKDEYEVARLHASPEFRNKLEAQFEGKYKLEFNLAPPIISPKDKVTGKPQKIQLGGWMLTAFGLMAKFKFLRGTAFDIFGKSAERKMERRFIEDYFNTVNELLETVSEENYELAVAIARIPEDIRGYGHIKEEYAEKAEAKWGSLLDNWRSGKSKPPLSAIEVEHVSS